ncbi:CDGSH iron-sulfur domain-containing protein [Streptomyces sp. NPDC021224]|uniref:CDGSH iron-sulfur domain-containing protein n=1 Tax=unclassified Streptomyces TaxID=2593676 RepID=UPI003799B850
MPNADERDPVRGTAREDAADAPPDACAPARRVTVESGGPAVVEDPVEVVTDDGTVAVSHRFAVAICTCRRSATYPWCDTSHRAHERPPRGDGGT